MTDQAKDRLLPETSLPGEFGSGDSEDIDRIAVVPQMNHVDLPNLHARMDHVARSLWDLQKCRVMIGNRIGEDDPEKAMARVLLQAFGDEAPLSDLHVLLKREEGKLNRKLEKLAKQHPLGEWVQNTRGVGLPSFARLMGLTGPLDRFANPAKLWKFVGMAVIDGRAPTRQRGVAWTHTDCKGGHLALCPPTCTTDHHKNCQPGIKGTAYSSQARVVCFQIADSFVKVGGPYRLLYDQKKAEYQARPTSEPSDCPFDKHHRNEAGKTIKCPKDHIHKAAMRFAVKRLLLHMWREWRRRSTGDVH